MLIQPDSSNKQTSADIITVVCVDDYPDIVELLRFAIDRQPDMRCVGCLFEIELLVPHINNMRPRPHVVIVDLTMPGGDPLNAIRELADMCPECRVIVYSGHDGRAIDESALVAGAWGCVSKHRELPTLLEAIRRVAKGETAFSG